MNIVMIHSSPRKYGVTSRMLSEIRGGISNRHTVESFDMNRMAMKPCIGCLKCRPGGECVLPRDDAHVLAESIRRSDLMVFGFPTYWGNIPGILKIFFDRNVTLFEYCPAESTLKPPAQRLKGKKAVLVTASGCPWPYNLLPSQSGGAIRAMKTVLKAGGIKIIRTVNVPDSYNFEKRKKRYFALAKNIGREIDSSR